jgi:hypothetical protein
MTDRLVSKVKDPFTLVLLGQIGQCDRLAGERAIALNFQNFERFSVVVWRVEKLLSREF